ncbi:hypothetical protein CRG98_029957 [Punica granatum]|uniref:Uncharacterized protein n=1 Tax=Punica granatum TaxID=22663 RepID=A0A2I0J136_PUNGR|nr:hypothetical protein CRG98_029957 [Punica granatum]
MADPIESPSSAAPSPKSSFFSHLLSLKKLPQVTGRVHGAHRCPVGSGIYMEQAGSVMSNSG